MRTVIGILLALLSSSVLQAQSFDLGDFLQPEKALTSKVDSLYFRLTSSQRIAQMIMPAGGEHGREISELCKLAQEEKIGGVLFLGGTSAEFQVYFDSLTTAQNFPFVNSLDAEPSLIPYKLRENKVFRKTNTIKDSLSCDSVVAQIDQLLKAVHVGINFAPVADLSPNKEIIGHRSFGAEDSIVIPLCEAFIARSLKDSILPVIKHFPGHGHVKGDSHKKLVYIDGSFQELEIFNSLIKNGAPAVMAGHIAVRNNAYETELPATCSRRILTDLLRDSLGFEGLIISDAFNMGAVSNLEDAPFLSALAGCDILLMPKDPAALHAQLMNRCKEDEVFAQQIEASVKRILRLKICLGLIP